MKFFCFTISLLFLLLSASDTYASVRNYVNAESSGGNSSVNVNIKNNVNTDSSSSVTSSTSSNTSVEIHQSGEGTSQVKVNGKEWKLEGPGNISVNEQSNGSTNLTPTPNPSPNLSPSTSPSPSPTEKPSPTPFEKIEEQFQSVLSEVFKKFEEVMDSFKKLFEK